MWRIKICRHIVGSGHGIGVLALIAVLVFAQTGWAGGPFVIHVDGQPQVWDTAQPVPFHADRGPLGLLTNEDAVALVREAFQVWEDVPSSSIAFAQAGLLPIDVTGDNVFDILGVEGDGISPIVFDHDGTVIDALLGNGAHRDVLGFAAIEWGQADRILEAQAVLNGTVLDGDASNPDLSRRVFLATIVHEFGHYINLDHSQINGEFANDGDAGNDDGLPTMFPLALDSDTGATLHRDDIATVSTLYPALDFRTSTGTIEGEIVLGNGITSFQGANVIARHTADPVRDAVSSVSGAFFSNSAGGGSPDLALRGRYAITGLPPGTYTVEVEQIDPTFTDSASVNPLDPPVILPGPEEFYNGEHEAGSSSLDPPAEKTEIDVGAGMVVTGVDILLNTLAIDDRDIGVSLALTKFKHKMRPFDDRVTAKLLITNVGGVVLTQPTSIQMWIASDVMLDNERDELVATDEILAMDLPRGGSEVVTFQQDGLASVDGKFATFVIANGDESALQGRVGNRVVQAIGGRGCVKDVLRREQEDSDNNAQVQSVGRIGINECITVTGAIENTLDVDRFTLGVKRPSTVEFLLTHGVADRLHISITDQADQRVPCTAMAMRGEVCVLIVPDGEDIVVPMGVMASRVLADGVYTLDIRTHELSPS